MVADQTILSVVVILSIIIILNIYLLVQLKSRLSGTNENEALRHRLNKINSDMVGLFKESAEWHSKRYDQILLSIRNLETNPWTGKPMTGVQSPVMPQNEEHEPKKIDPEQYPDAEEIRRATGW